MLLGGGADIVHGELLARLDAVDALVLSAVIHKGALDVVHQGDEQHVAHEKADAQQSLYQSQDHLIVDKHAQKVRYSVGNAHEDDQGDKHRQDDCTRHLCALLALGLGGLLGGEFLLICRLLLEVGGGIHQRGHAHDQGVHKGDNAAQDGHLLGPLWAQLHLLCVHVNAAIGKAQGHCHLLVVAHHHTFHYGLSADT